ncbi:MAG: hypothetical protein PWP24_84 [Clostridiales bacterium]|nr:hypothetical protein [Clostridiales bacterium]
MRIGSFVKKNHTTIDTIRHYIELGLLLPEKSGAVYDFDERCQDDLEEIFSFKEMGFSLQDIKFILYFKRLAKLTSYQEDDYFSQLFHNKQNELSKKNKTATLTTGETRATSCIYRRKKGNPSILS